MSGQGAAKFRRLTGSLRLLQELKPGAHLSKTMLKRRSTAQQYRWNGAMTCASKAAPPALRRVVSAKSQLFQIEEQRTRYVDAQQNPLALSEAAAGFDVTEVATVSLRAETRPCAQD